MGVDEVALASPAEQTPQQAMVPPAAPSPVASAPLMREPVPVPAAVPRPEPKAQRVQRGSAHAARAVAPAAVAPSTRTPSPHGSAAPEAGRDPDVDLVAALMAHVAVSPASAVRGVGRVSGPESGTAPRAAPPATLDQRVQRCKASHPDDREASRACRRRVCDSHWGRHPACPVRLMPRSATTA